MDIRFPLCFRALSFFVVPQFSYSYGTGYPTVQTFPRDQTTSFFVVQIYSKPLVFRQYLRLDASLRRVNPNLLNTPRSNLRLFPLLQNRNLILNRRINITLGSNRQHFRLVKGLSSLLPLLLLRFPLDLRTNHRLLPRNLRNDRYLNMFPRLHPKGVSLFRTLFLDRLPKSLNRTNHLPNRGLSKTINTPRRHSRRRRGTRGTIRHLRV